MTITRSAASKKTVAIDFGTTTTLVAIRRGEALPEVLAIGPTNQPSLMPSIIDSDDIAVVGESVSPDRAHRSVKSDLTLLETQPMSEQHSQLAEARVRAIIREAVRRAEERVPDLLQDAVVFIGCPALWSGPNRKKLATIVYELGIPVDYGNVIDEPVAAGISWVREQWLRGGEKPTGNVVVFDPGGGTLDIAYLNVAANTESEIPDISIYFADSIPKSGDYADELLAKSLVEMKPELLPYAKRRELRDAARLLKEQLSFSSNAAVNTGAPVNRVLQARVDDLNVSLRPLIDDIERLLENVVRGSLLRTKSGFTPHQIRLEDYKNELATKVNYVVLSGGLSHIPIFRELLQNIFHHAQLVILDQPQEAVVAGLCYGNELVHLNLPRPPISFYARVKSKDGKGKIAVTDHCVYEAYSPIFTREKALAGSGEMCVSWSAESAEPMRVEFFAVIPTIQDVPLERRRVRFERTMPAVKGNYPLGKARVGDPVPQPQNIPIVQKPQSFINVPIEHDSRYLHGEARFVMYPTAEIVFSGKDAHYEVRIESWTPTPGNFDRGNHEATARVWYQPTSQDAVNKLDTEAWRDD